MDTTLPDQLSIIALANVQLLRFHDEPRYMFLW
jgi:hypothetical protein